jgi:hypothetical protein
LSINALFQMDVIPGVGGDRAGIKSPIPFPAAQADVVFDSADASVIMSALVPSVVTPAATEKAADEPAVDSVNPAI